jgi:hypothetical protein
MWRFALIASLAVFGCSSDQGPIVNQLPEIEKEDEFGLFARGGIELDRVVIDQGVSIELFEDGAEVPPSRRRTDVVGGRTALFRTFWTLPDDWEPRPIVARLRLHMPDGEVLEAVEELFIDGEPIEYWYENGAFNTLTPPELVVGDMKWDMTLYEAGDPPEDSLPPAVVPRAPHDGPGDLGVDPAPRELDVVIVPIDHQFDGGKDCPDVPPEFEADRLQRFADGLFAQNPVQGATVSVRDEPLVWDESAANLGKILGALGELRDQDGADPWVYYYGAIEPCDWGSDEGFAGLAYLPKETKKGEDWRRVSVGDVAVSESATIETFVHEVGHNQERRHVPCGGPKGAVEDYPYRNGKIGTYGFDILRIRIHRPNERDYMSYCGPEWVSDYGWNQVLPVIGGLTSWKNEETSAEPEGGMVIGHLFTDGTETWRVRPGDPSLVAERSGTMDYFAGAEHLAGLPVAFDELDDGTITVVGPLPASFGRATRLEMSGDGERRVIARDAVKGDLTR